MLTGNKTDIVGHELTLGLNKTDFGDRNSRKTERSRKSVVSSQTEEKKTKIENGLQTKTASFFSLWWLCEVKEMSHQYFPHSHH